MELQKFTVQTRPGEGRAKVRKLRNKGLVPGVVYGGDQAPLSIAFGGRAFGHLVHSKGGQHAIVQLDVEDDPSLSTPALLKAVAHHPVRGEAIHADFLRIRLDERISTMVPLRFEGQAIGLRDGGIMDHQVREIEVECLALEVPDEIVVNVTELKIGDTIHAGELAVPEGVTIVTDPERPVAAVLAPRVMETAAPVEAAAATEGGTEPVVIGEKKREEEKK
ncbi:MAG: large subunit ribosomal protein [Candidatus Hydrogenedentes bacterium]|nr:large subunit ribosomal protein [Candidatus Hydrogenedentota bacterium]